MISQQNHSMSELDCEALTFFPEASRANLTALVENIWRLMTSAICGGNSTESLASLDPDGSWQKMYGAFCQVSMDGFSDEFCETWPDGGAVHGGIAFRPELCRLPLEEIELPLWPRPLASEGIAWTRINRADVRGSLMRVHNGNHQERLVYHFAWNGLSVKQAADFCEMMMGFPPRWTVLDAQEIP